MVRLKNRAFPSRYTSFYTNRSAPSTQQQLAMRREGFQNIDTPTHNFQPPASFSIHSIYNDINSVSKPTAWIRNNLSCDGTPVVTFSETKCRKDRDVYITFAEKEVTIGDTLKLNCTIMGQRINISNFQVQTGAVKSIGEVERVLEKLNSLKVCVGSSDAAIGEKNKPVAAYRDKYGQWRHRKCPLLLRLKTRCKFCERVNKMKRKTLLFRRKGSERKDIEGPAGGSAKDFNDPSEKCSKEIRRRGLREKRDVRTYRREFVSVGEIKIEEDTFDSTGVESFSYGTVNRSTVTRKKKAKHYILPMKLENAIHAESQETFYVVPKVRLTRVEDSKDPEVRRYLKKGDETLTARSVLNAKEPRVLEFAHAEVKCEAVDLETLTYETVKSEDSASNLLATSEEESGETTSAYSYPVEQTLTETDETLWSFCGMLGNNVRSESTSQTDSQSASGLTIDADKDMEAAVKNVEQTLTEFDDSSLNLCKINNCEGYPETRAVAEFQYDQCKEWLNSANGSRMFAELRNLGREADGSKAQSSVSAVERRIYVCKLCQKAFTRLSSYRRHVMSLLHTGKRLHPCDVCQKSFSQRGHLTRHMATHMRPSRCDYCRDTDNQDSIEAIREQLPRYHCEVCHKSYVCKSHLKAHLLIHTGERPFRCDVCHKTFRQKSHRTTHMLTHTGERAYRCDECQKSFCSKHYLQQHIFNHTGKKAYRCRLCRKPFSSESCLRKHISIHTGEKPYQCKVCCKLFRLNGNLKTHMIVHSEERPYQCNICYKKFRRKDSHSKHMLMHARGWR